MSRTPTMTAQELEALLGPRGALIVTKDNRPNAKKWMTAMGVPADFAATMPYRWLADAYNDLSGASLERAKTHAVKGQGARLPLPDAPAPQPGAPDMVPLPSPDGMVPQAREEEQDAQDDARSESETDETAAALDALRVILGKKNTGGLDADAVRAIIRKELPNLIPVTRLEIKTPQGVKDHGTKPRHKQLKELIQVMSTGCHAVLVGPAGSGKTLAVEQACEALELEFRITGAIQGAHELLGYEDGHGRYHETAFRDAFQNGHAMCLDEIDGGDPAGQLVANSALANCYMPFPDSPKPIKRHDKFIVAACANTFGNGADRQYVGRNQLDAAFLDRFVFIPWHYDETLERTIAGNDDWVDRVQALRRGCEKEKARIVISLRASIHGAKLLNAGISRSRVEELCIWKGTDADLRRRIESHNA